MEVNHCLLIGNETGLRFGDWTANQCDGSLEVINSISVGNSLNNAWNYVEARGEAQPGAMQISYSMVDQSNYDTLQGCLEGVPKFDSEWVVRPNQPGSGDGLDGLDIGLLEWGQRK